MPDYKNGKIYKIINNKDNQIYVGSTTQTLSQRFTDHKKSTTLKRCEKWKIIKHMNQIGKKNFKIILIEEIKCKNKDTLTAREQYWMDLLKPTLNQCFSNGKDYKKLQNKWNKADNKRKELRKHDIIICECGTEVRKQWRIQHKKTKYHIKFMEMLKTNKL